jgi:hypothetical protein
VRHVLAPTREDLVDREGECIIAVEGTVINSVFAEKRLANNVTAKKRWEATCFKTASFKAPKIL